MPRPITYYGSFIQRAVLSVSVLMITVHLQYTAPTLRALWLLHSDSKNNMHNRLPIIIPKFALSKFFPTLKKKREKKGGGGKREKKQEKREKSNQFSNVPNLAMQCFLREKPVAIY